MDRSLYTAASTLHVQQGVMDAASVNIANLNTVGYRRAVPVARGFQLEFGEAISRSPSHAGTPVPGGGARLAATVTDVRQGPLRQTGGTLDLALEGPGFFVLQTPGGFRYTRAGNFQLNRLGELVTPSGDPVLGQGGAVVIQGGDVQFGPDGAVIVDGVEIDRLQLVQFPDAQALVRVGANQYDAPPAAERQVLDATQTTVHQHQLEDPNLNAIEELVQMIAAQRGYEMAARNIRLIDRTLEIAVQDIARP